MFCKNGVLKDFAKFPGKHLCWSFFLIKLQAWKKNFMKKINLLRNSQSYSTFPWFTSLRAHESVHSFPKTFIKMFPNDSRVRRNNTISKSKLLLAWKVGKSPIWLLVYVKCVGFNSLSVSYSTYKQIQKTQVKDLKMKIKLLLQNYLWLDF